MISENDAVAILNDAEKHDIPVFPDGGWDL